MAETVGLLSVSGKINEIQDGLRIQNLRVSGLVVTKMDNRVRGHRHLLDELKVYLMRGKMIIGVIILQKEVDASEVNFSTMAP